MGDAYERIRISQGEMPKVWIRMDTQSARPTKLPEVWEFEMGHT